MKILHPFSKISNPEVRVIGADNYYVRNTEGYYLDAISGIYNCPLGYSVNSIKQAIVDSLHTLPTNHIFSSTPDISQTHSYARRLEQKLSDLVPFSKCVFFTNSGSEAVDSAINLCRIKSSGKRNVVMSYNGSYHGSTFSTLAASGNLSKDSSTNKFVDFYHFHSNKTPGEYITYIENRILEIGPESILAFIAEPFIGASGGFFMKKNILPDLKNLLHKYGIFLILDEVISGFGRLGTMFAFQKYNVEPDVLVLSKAITNGYMPMACAITSFDFDPGTVMSFGFSTAAHPSACAAALASVKLIESAIQNGDIAHLESYVKQKFEEYSIAEKCYKIDSCGLFLAMHFSSSKDEYVQHTENVGGKLASRLRDNGIIARGNPKSLIISPGFYMLPDHIDRIVGVISEEM
jgi:putrescine aminotransferase